MIPVEVREAILRGSERLVDDNTAEYVAHVPINRH